MSNDRSSIECRKSFSELLQVHARLDELFLDHQRALLRLDLSTALDALEAYETELLTHWIRNTFSSVCWCIMTTVKKRCCIRCLIRSRLSRRETICLYY